MRLKFGHQRLFREFLVYFGRQFALLIFFSFCTLFIWNLANLESLGQEGVQISDMFD